MSLYGLRTGGLLRMGWILISTSALHLLSLIKSTYNVSYTISIDVGLLIYMFDTFLKQICKYFKKYGHSMTLCLFHIAMKKNYAHYYYFKKR